MRVFILIGGWEYEGETILNIYDNKKLAEEQKRKHERLSVRYDFYEIEEHEVKK